MMYLSYESPAGKVNLCGGAWNVTSITGLGLVEKSYQAVSYAGQDGQQTLSSVTPARVITLAGDISGNLQYEFSRGTRIFYQPGIFKIYSHSTARAIAVRGAVFSEEERLGSYGRFLLQLTCDEPFFRDLDKKSVALFGRSDVYGEPFTLPCVFTQRLNSARVINKGDVPVQPVLRVKILADTQSVSIVNQSTGAQVAVTAGEVPYAAGDELMIDLAARKISSAVQGDILKRKSLDTVLSRFWLEPGKNELYVELEGAGEVWCEFYNKYVEAVY